MVAMMEGGGGRTLSEIYQNSQRLKIRVRSGIEKLEQLEFTSAPSTPELSYSINKDIDQIRSLSADMECLSRSIPSKPQRDLWNRKIENVAQDVEQLKKSLENYTERNNKRMMEARQRAELLERVNGESSHVLRIFDDEAQAMQSARNSSKMLEEALDTGVAILSKYAGQREVLKLWVFTVSTIGNSAHDQRLWISCLINYRFLCRGHNVKLDTLNTIGLSNSVLKLIERRHRVDKWVAYTGMAVTIILVYAFWRLTH
ncbi:hypothetical protein IFM89_033012 [Coptis chinensis]|uniref:Membrin n=1 Tax=Coptis chinensis TaxID=261450 RepID=A0A835M5A5_9MAGN|nr:hypothetical protein IFM89_033012 [Coptis chinensis]